jgi:hypothetical protein
MRGLSTRELATLAYERGQELDPTEMPAPDLIDALVLAAQAGVVVPAPAMYERSRRDRRVTSGNTPASASAPWPPMGAYGEPISQLPVDDRLVRGDATPLAEQAQEEST